MGGSLALASGNTVAGADGTFGLLALREYEFVRFAIGDIDIDMTLGELMEDAAQAFAINFLSGTAIDVGRIAVFTDEAVGLIRKHRDHDGTAAGAIIIILSVCDEKGDAFDLRAAIDAGHKGAIDVDIFAIVFFGGAFVVAGGILSGK